MNLPPLSLYIHIPWCLRKCPYCDFNSHAVRGALDEAGYVAALLADLNIEAALAGERELQSIFIGGGTPSLFSPAAIDDLLRGVRERLPWAQDIEITMEANPGAVEAAQFAELRETGVNRLSIGVQSFHAESLRALGRIHGPEEAVRAVELAQAAGFERINLDLMFGLPQASEAQALEDVNIAIGLNTEHLSYYQLTLEPNTLFHHQPPQLPDEETLWSIQQEGQRLLAQAGYQQYEVSAFARPGGRCRHNLNYWRFGDYIGIGAGAHGKLTQGDGNIQRRWKKRHPDDYLCAVAAGNPLQGSRQLSPEDRVVEFMMNALRLSEGVESGLFPATTGLDSERLAGMLDEARGRGLLSKETTRLCATPLGLRFLTNLLEIFEVEKQL
ncbi:MAG: radical SAM family heme chaperone HemW [Candidatus Thiodiazotropha sp.]